MHFIQRTRLWFVISALLIIPGMIAWAVWGLKIGIDFRGGSLIELEIQGKAGVAPDTIRAALAEVELETLIIQPTGQGNVILRTEPVNQEKHAQILASIDEKVGKATEIRFESVGPTVSQELTRKAIIAVIVAAFAIILYVAWSFRGLPRPASSWKFGVTAVFALLHDLLFTIGAFAILGHWLGYEVDSLFITALLTVMGFSVHDTIVVFDRIRENLKRSPNLSFHANANSSLTQTLGRSLGTSVTVIFVLLALFILGPETTKQFIAALLLGITIGTYSSIFFATPLLVLWHKPNPAKRLR